MTFKSKWEEWRHEWLYVRVDSYHGCLADPEMVAVHDNTFKELSPQDVEMEDIVKRIKALQERSLMGHMVAADYLWWRLAPLQQRSHPAWAYTGVVDRTRLWPGLDYNLRPNQHGQMM